MTARDASDALPVRRATAIHSSTNGRATTGWSTAMVPAAVATPRPPLKRRKAGKQWPSTAASPQARAISGPPAARPAAAATAPLAASPANTASPARIPASRYTLEAPGLPEPSAVGSCPASRATMSAVGNVPNRYERARSPPVATDPWYGGMPSAVIAFLYGGRRRRDGKLDRGELTPEG